MSRREPPRGSRLFWSLPPSSEWRPQRNPRAPNYITWVNAAETLPHSYHCPLQVSRLAFSKASRCVPVSQEKSQEPSQQQPVFAQQTRARSTLLGKRLLALLAISLLVVLILTVRPSFIKAAWAGFARILHSKNTPLPASPAKTSDQAMRSPSAMATQQQTSPSAEALAQNLWAALDKSGWGSSLEAWSSLHPDIPCAPFRGNMWGGGADRQ